MELKVGDVIIISELIDESPEHKTYDSDMWKIKQIRITANKPNIIVERYEPYKS